MALVVSRLARRANALQCEDIQVVNEKGIQRMNKPFANKVALVTGAASGMGLSTAQAFAEAGAAVVLAVGARPSGQASAGTLVSRCTSARRQVRTARGRSFS